MSKQKITVPFYETAYTLQVVRLITYAKDSLNNDVPWPTYQYLIAGAYYTSTPTITHELISATIFRTWADATNQRAKMKDYKWEIVSLKVAIEDELKKEFELGKWNK